MIAEVVLRYQGKEYAYRHHFAGDRDGDYPWASVEYMYREGNYSCDCNRSTFIQRDDMGNVPDFPDLDCGDAIALVSLTPVAYSGPFLPDEPWREYLARADAGVRLRERGVWLPD